jgi:hypothetical protein
MRDGGTELSLEEEEEIEIATSDEGDSFEDGDRETSGASGDAGGDNMFSADRIASGSEILG